MEPANHLNLDTLKALAEASAVAAATRVSADLKEEVRNEIRSEFKVYFGGMDPSRHIVAHDRMERLLNLLDRLGENIFGKILQNLILGAMVVGLVGYAAYLKFFGGQ